MWPFGIAIVTGICLVFITVFIFATRRRIFRIEKDFKRLSEVVKGLQVAEERRFLKELKVTKKEDDPPSMAPSGDVGGETLRVVAGKESIRQ